MENFIDATFVVEELTTDNLKDLNVSRAKLWSKWLNDMAAKSMTENVDDAVEIEKFEEVYGPEDEEQANETDEDNYEEKCVDSLEIDDSGLDITVIEQNVTVSNAHNVLAVIAQNPNTTGIINDDREFLEKTLPFFENYNRELRTNGFDKVLCTFNEEEIDRKAGKMMLHSAQTEVSPNKKSRHFCDDSYYMQKHFDADDDTDSDSVDTARYIRLSKKECKSRKQYATKTTTIKSYRMIQSKRDQLHKKYSYLLSGETIEELYRNKTSFNCSAAGCHQSWAGPSRSVHYSVGEARFAQKSHCCQLDYNSSISSCASFEEGDLLHLTERCGTGKICFSSSLCSCYHCHARSRCISNSFKSHQRQHHLYRHHDHNSYQCCNSILPLHHKFKYKSIKENKIGSNDMSCNKICHLTNFGNINDSSKSYGIPKQPKALQFTTCKERFNSKNDNKLNLVKQTETNFQKEPLTIFTNACKHPYIENKFLKKNDGVHKKRLEQQKSSKLKVNTASIQLVDANEDGKEDSFETELQLAIEASKKVYVEELKKKNNSNSFETEFQLAREASNFKETSKKSLSFKKNPKNSNKVQIRKEVRKVKSKKKRYTPELAAASTESDNGEEENLRHKSYKKLQANKNDCKSIDKQRPPRDKSRNKKKKEHTKLTAIETLESIETVLTASSELNDNTNFFTNNNQLCNSTAMQNNVKQCEKSSSSTTIQSSTTKIPKDNIPSSTVLNDCTVSSTSGLETPLNSIEAASKIEEKRLISNSGCDSSIILYAPHNNSMQIPNSSFVNERYRLTLEHLGAIIGEKYAKVFFRYYKGKRDFMLSSTVFYVPPKRGYYSGNDTNDSDIDILDVPDIGRIVEKGDSSR